VVLDMGSIQRCPMLHLIVIMLLIAVLLL